MTSELVYSFGYFRLMPVRRQLLAAEQQVKLGGRAFDLLLALVQHERMLTKGELFDLAWPGLVVEENNLNVQVLMLRKVLGHAAIATIPGRGYRFALPVTVEGGTAREGPVAPPAAAPPTTMAPANTNLPGELPGLYGRGDDADAVSALLKAHPVVTITGAGGIGKTRLGQAVASRVLAEYPDGVWWIELAALSNASLVPATIALVLGLSLDGQRPAADTVISALRARRVLLVLDNCEHLLDEVAAFVDAVRAAAPGVRLLLTSQEALKLGDEHVYRLGTLALPVAAPGGATPALAVVAGSGAGSLFVARARALDPRFELNTGNVDAVVEICRRLDGIPLAIELAVARVPLLGVEGVRARLKERFNVLTGGTRAVLRRHQTLRAALEWSHGLLSTSEQAVFRRLGVFAGGFTLESAQRVAEDEAVDPWDVLEHLGTLVDKSLVLAEGASVPRYRMLETTRLFALEQLGTSGETEPMLRRHAEAIVAVLEPFAQAGDALLEEHEMPLVAEADNIRAALDWLAASPGPADDVLAIELGGIGAAALASICGYFGEAFDRTLALSPRVGPAIPPAIAARFWLTLARVGSTVGRVESYDAAGRAAELFQRLGDDVHRYIALTSRIAIGARLGKSAALAHEVAEAARIERADWPVLSRSAFLWARYRWLQAEGRLEEALAAALQRALLHRATGAPLLEQMVLGDIVADSELALGHVDAAEAHTRSALAALEGQLGWSWAVAHVLENLALVCAAQGKHEEAIEKGRATLRMSRASGPHFRLLEPMALNAARQGRLRDAAWAAGHVDHLYAQRGEVRWPAVRARRAELDALLAAGLDAAELSRLRSAGAAADIDAAFERAFAQA